MLSLPARGRLRVIRLGLRDCSTPLLRLLLRRRLSVSLLPTVRPYSRGPAAATAATAESECRRRWKRRRRSSDGRSGGGRRSLLFAAPRFCHLDALLRRLHEYRVRAPAGHGGRPVRLFLVVRYIHPRHRPGDPKRRLFPVISRCRQVRASFQLAVMMMIREFSASEERRHLGCRLYSVSA